MACRKWTLITGVERRRRWSADEREQILAAVNAPGAVVAEVGRRWDICTSLIYKWLREERQAARESGFTPVIVKSEPHAVASDPPDAAITVDIGGARVRIGADAPAALVMATLKALRSLWGSRLASWWRDGHAARHERSDAANPGRARSAPARTRWAQCRPRKNNKAVP